MARVFNSGKGSYTCDVCAVLLWDGPENSKEIRTLREYNYSHKPGEIYKTSSGKYVFCKKCGPKSPSTRIKEGVR